MKKVTKNIAQAVNENPFLRGLLTENGMYDTVMQDYEILALSGRLRQIVLYLKSVRRSETAAMIAKGIGIKSNGSRIVSLQLKTIMQKTDYLVTRSNTYEKNGVVCGGTYEFNFLQTENG